MHILSEGRKDFLDFLRNLTPQAILLSMSFLTFQKMVYEELYTQRNIFLLAIATIFTLTWLAATYCSITLFLENSIRLPELDRGKPEGTIDFLRKLIKNIIICWKFRKTIFLEILIIFIIIETSVVITMYNAIQITANLLRHA